MHTSPSERSAMRRGMARTRRHRVTRTTGMAGTAIPLNQKLGRDRPHGVRPAKMACQSALDLEPGDRHGAHDQLFLSEALSKRLAKTLPPTPIQLLHHDLDDNNVLVADLPL